MKLFNKLPDSSYNVLLTCAGGGLSKYNAYFLKQNKNKFIKVIGVDIKKIKSKKNFDKFYKISNTKNKKFIIDVNRIVKKERISLIIPTSDEEVIKFSTLKGFFKRKGVDIACENKKNVKIFTDKFKTLNFLKKSKIDKQKFFLIKNNKELRNKLVFFKEFVLKPVQGRGGRGVYIVRQKVKETLYLNFGREITTDLKRFKKYFLKKIESFPYILTAKLKEPVFDVDFLSSRGKLLKIVMRKRLVSEEPNSGHEFCPIPKQIKKKFSAICKKLKLNGLYDSDLMRDEKNLFRIIEINSRPSGSVSTTCAAGINLLSDLINLKIRKKINRNSKINKKKVKLF